MTKGGIIFAIAGMAFLIFAAMPAQAAIAVPSTPPLPSPQVPPMPAPPASIGPCMAVAQAFANGAGASGADGRSVALAAIGHQTGEGEELLGLGLEAATPDENASMALVLLPVTAIGDAGEALNHSGNAFSQALGPSAARMTNGLLVVLAATAPITNETLKATVPWSGAMYAHYVMPVFVWERDTTPSNFQGNTIGNASNPGFVFPYLAASTKMPSPPIGAGYGGVAKAEEGIAQSSDGASMFLNALAAIPNSLAFGTGGMMEAWGPTVDHYSGGAAALAAGSQANAGSMTTLARMDADAFRAALGNGANGLVAGTQMLPSKVQGCAPR